MVIVWICGSWNRHVSRGILLARNGTVPHVYREYRSTSENQSSFLQVMAWRRPYCKPLPEPTMTQLIDAVWNHCVTINWVKHVFCSGFIICICFRIINRILRKELLQNFKALVSSLQVMSLTAACKKTHFHQCIIIYSDSATSGHWTKMIIHVCLNVGGLAHR